MRRGRQLTERPLALTERDAGRAALERSRSDVSPADALEPCLSRPDGLVTRATDLLREVTLHVCAGPLLCNLCKRGRCVVVSRLWLCSLRFRFLLCLRPWCLLALGAWQLAA